MYQIRSLELINFGSHKHTKYNFPEHQTTLITGINETDRGQKSNGSGKSFIIEGLSFALLGSSLRKIKDKELVMDGEKESTINLVLYNPVNEHTLDITRKIYSNTKSGELKIAGEIGKNITSIPEGNAKILECLDLTRDDILNYFLLSKERYTSFFSSSDTAKKELINRFSKADQIQVCIDSCEDDIKHYQSEVDSYQKDIEDKKVRIEAFKDAHGTNNQSAIQTLESENKTLTDQIAELTKTIEDSGELIEALESEVQSAKEIFASHEPKVKEINQSIKEYEELIDEMDKSLRNKVECPKCSHEFSLKDNKVSIEEARELYPIIENSIQELNIEKKLKQEDLTKAENSLKYARQELNEAEFAIKRLINDRAMHERMIKNNTAQIERLSKVDDNSGKIEKLKLDIAALESMLIKSQTNLSLATEWKLRFLRFKGYLANKSLSNIQSHANFYLDKLGSDLTIELEGFTPIKNGKELREKINTKVFRNGQEASFNRFSGGERARIEVAIILGMQRIINQSAEGLGIDFLCLDEIIESTDSEGVEILVKALNQLKQNIMVITHVGMDFNYENTLVVKKIDGISEII